MPTSAPSSRNNTGEPARTISTRSLQAEIDHVSATGGGEVTIPDGEHRIGTLWLRDGVTLRLGAGAKLIGTSNLADYPLPKSSSFVDAVGQERGRTLILAENASNVGIVGEGTIDGSGGSFAEGQPSFEGRPFLCRFVRCRNVTLRNVELANSAAWVCHLLNCADVLIDGIRIHSLVNHNNDGIDVDSCQRVTIRNCEIETGDDSICLKTTSDGPCEDILVERCTLFSRCGTIKLGTESYGDFRRIIIRDCRVTYAGLSAIKIITMDGGIIDDVQISNIQIESGTGPIFVRLGHRSRVYEPDHPPKGPGAIRNVCIQNIRAPHITVPAQGGTNYFTKEPVAPLGFAGILITGIPDQAIENLTLRDIEISLPGGGGPELLERNVPQMRDHYPEHFYFGPTPAHGLFARHVRGLSISGFKCTTALPDARPAVRLDDVVQG